MAKAKPHGSPFLPTMTEPNPIPFKNLWKNDTHDEAKKNKEKETVRVEEVRQRWRFIVDGILKFIDY